MASVGKRVTRRPAKRRKGRDGNNNPFDGVDNFAEGLWLAIITFAGVPAVGALSWYAFSGWWRVFAVTLAAASGSGLAAWVWLEAAPRSIYLRIRVTTSTALAGWSIAVHTILSPILWWRIWVPISIVILAWWCIPKTPAVRGYGGDGHPEKDTLAEQLGIGGTKAKLVDISDDGVRTTLELTHRDHPVKAVQSVIPALAAKAGLPPNGVRIIPGQGDAGKSRMVIVRKDVLTEPTPWAGPSAPGESWAIPARIGVREDGTPLELLRPGPKGEMASTAVQGITGSGKTEGELCELAELITRKDVVIWWADARKADQTLPDIEPAIDYVARTIPEIRAMVAGINRAVTARSAWLGRRGMRYWTPDCGIPGILVILEEAAAVMSALDRALKDSSEMVRSTGIALSVSMQRWSSMNAGDEGTDLRAQLPVGWCFHIKNGADADFVLTDATLEAGADPSAFTKPGMCYLEAWHVDQDEWSMPARTFRLPAEVLRPHVAEWAPRMARLDETTARAMGPSYADRPVVSVSDWMAGLEARGLGIGAQRGRRIVDLAMARDDETETAMEAEAERLDSETRAEVAADLAAIADETTETGDDDGDEDEEIAMDTEALRAYLARDDDEVLSGIAEVRFGDLNLAESTFEQRLGAFLQFVESLGRLPRDIQTKRFVDWFMDHGLDPSKGRPAVTRLVRRLVAAGGAEDRAYGRWTILPTAPGLLRAWLSEGDLEERDSGAEDYAMGGSR